MPFRMPNSGNNSGNVLSIRNEPPGFSGANIDSQARHKKISAIRLAPAPMLSAFKPPRPLRERLVTKAVERG